MMMMMMMMMTMTMMMIRPLSTLLGIRGD